MQLVAYGAQDVYLTGNPQITFFKVVYRRHTNFAVESIEQTFNGTVGFGKKVTATISRNGDLITNCWVQLDLPALTGGAGKYCNSIGHRVLKEIELEIGGQRIDKHYSDWLEIWSELTMPAEKREGYKTMVGKYDTANGHTGAQPLFVPLMFFFNRNPGLALPLIALQYHEVKINIQFESLANCVAVTGSTITTSGADLSASLYVDYVYLDTDERKRFAQVSHEMLIEQLQYTGADSVSQTEVNKRYTMNFNHPVKELVWVLKNNDDSPADPFDYSASNSEATDSDSIDNTWPGSSAMNEDDAVKTVKIMLNSHERFSQRSGRYFRLVQPYQHHTAIPRRHIYCYSFALKPEEHQPSGTCNFSRIDNATLHLGLKDNHYMDELQVYAVNYNVLRIMSGMGGLAYSN